MKPEIRNQILSTNLLEDILAYIVSETLHDVLVFCGAFAVLLANNRDQPEICAQIERDLFGDLQFQSILHLCHIDSSFRSITQDLLSRLFPVDIRFQDVRIESTLRMPKSLRNQIDGREQTFARSHSILNSLYSLYNLGTCCLEICTTGAEDLYEAEEIFDSLRAMQSVQVSPVARIYLLLSRLRITLHAEIKGHTYQNRYIARSQGSPSFNDNFMEIALLDPPLTPWYSGFLYGPIQELSFTHLCLGIVMASKQAQHALFETSMVVFQLRDQPLEDILDAVRESVVETGLLDRAHRQLDSVKNVSLVFARGLGQEPEYGGPAPRSIRMTNQSMFLVADKILDAAWPLKRFLREQSDTEPDSEGGILVDILKLKEKALVLCNVDDPE